MPFDGNRFLTKLSIGDLRRMVNEYLFHVYNTMSYYEFLNIQIGFSDGSFYKSHFIGYCDNNSF